MRICGSLKKSFVDGELYDVWIEGPTGGVAVKGTMRTVVERPVRQDMDAEKVRFVKATTRVPDEKHRKPRIHTVSKDEGTLAPATSVDRLKGSNCVEILSNTANETATPLPEERHAPATAEDTGALVRQSARLSAKATPNLRRRKRTQREFVFRTLKSPKLMLSKFATPPVTSPSSETEQSSTVEDASRTASSQPFIASTQELPRTIRCEDPKRIESKQEESIVIRRTQAPASPMIRKVSYRTRQLLRRAARARHAEATPETGLIRKHVSTPYSNKPADFAHRYSSAGNRGVRKVTFASMRKIAIPNAREAGERAMIKPKQYVWQRY
jgi:hypothetical protein